MSNTNAPTSSMIETTEDLFLDGKVRLIQPVEGYRAATDPVLLAASIPARSGQKVLDIGCGVGAASFCLRARVQGLKIWGLELQEQLWQIALENRRLNQAEDDIEFIHGDLLDRNLDLPFQSFDHVMANPPYFEAGSINSPPNDIKATAHVEGDARLNSWVDFALRMVKPKGTITFILRTERLEDLLLAIRGRLGELTLFPIWSHDPVLPQAKPAKRFILSGRPNLRSPMQISPGLVIHEADGNYRQQAQDILRHGAALTLRCQ